ncbi:MAG: hypothetical protein IH944_05520 [Armatimonadetes bacterium]|nr:hypothetical protein [Armatimonadota bacterium]
MAYVAAGPNAPKTSIDFAVITDSFNTIIAHWQAYLTAGVVMIGVSLPVALADLVPSPTEIGFSGFKYDFAVLLTVQVLLFLPTLIVTPLMCFGVTKYTLNVTRGNAPDMAHIWEGFRHPFAYLWTAVLSGFVSFLGLILCIIGAYVTGGLMMFAYPLKVDTNVSGSLAVSMSWAMLKHEWLLGAVLYLVLGMIAGLGAFVEPIGAAFTLPFMFVAQVHLYNRFTGHYVAPPPVPQQQTPAPGQSAPPTPQPPPSGPNPYSKS